MIEGLDVSRWQPPEDLDYQAIADSGHAYAAIRASVGDYYGDTTFPVHWDMFGMVGLLRTPYLVVAPADSVGRKISVSQHMNKFYEVLGDRQAELPWVVDCELTRDQSRGYITDLISGIVETCEAQLGRHPIIYTRQTWWDPNVYARSLWSKCPLFPARYYPELEGPWADGNYKFRDWTVWHFWQYTKNGRVPNYGGSVDKDRFNGTMEELLAFSMGGLTHSDEHRILWREAGLHGWNLTL